jgi:hypothetical protein
MDPTIFSAESRCMEVAPPAGADYMHMHPAAASCNAVLEFLYRYL